MNWILLVRIASTTTFLLLVAGAIVALVWIPRFVRLYFKEHTKLEARVSKIERHLNLPER